MIATSLVILYVATKCLDQFIKEEGYGRIKQVFFPKQKYINVLRDLIIEVVDDFAKTDQNTYIGKIAFYHSPEVFQALMDHVLFKELNLQQVLEKLSENPNVQPPQSREVRLFFESFYRKVKSNSNLKKMFVEENYQAEIFEISGMVTKMNTQLTNVAINVSSIHSMVSGLSNTAHPVITGDYVAAPEESELYDILNNKHVLLLSGVSFCGKSQLAKKIAERFVVEGYKYAGGTEVAEADRFLRNLSGNHIYLLEDPFGHSFEVEGYKSLRKIEELIRNLAPGNKLIITTRSEVLLSAKAVSNIQQCTIEGHSWSELTIRTREFLSDAWAVMAVELPYDCRSMIESHLKNDDTSQLLQVGQLAHLSRLPTDTLNSKPLETLLHMAKADSRNLSVEIKARGVISTRLYTVLGLATSTTQGIKMNDLAYILADTDNYPGFLKRQGLRTYSSKRADEVSFPLYDQYYVLNEDNNTELSFFTERGYLEISNSQVYFRHPTYQEAARYLLLEASVFEIENILNKIKRTLGCLSARNASYLARQLSFIYKSVHQTDLKSGILRMIYKLANYSIFPAVRDLLLKFLLEILEDMDQEKQDGTFQLIDADMSSSDIFWEADQPFFSNFDRDFFDEDSFDEIIVKQSLTELNSAEEMSALKLWSIVQLISNREFELEEFPDTRGIDRLLNAEETFIRSKIAFTILNKIPSVDYRILDRIFGDANPSVVVEAIRGAIFGYSAYTPQQRQDILPMLQRAVTNGFVIARIKTLLTCFGIDYGPDHIDWEEISLPDSKPMWELWGMLFPVFMENMPISVSINNSGRFGQTMDASIAYLKNTTSGLQVASSFYNWVDARITNGLMPDTYELGVISYLLEISDDHVARLPLFEKIFQYPKSSLVLYSLSWALSDWGGLSQNEKQVLLNLCASDRIDKRWITATAITRPEPPSEIQQLLFGRPDLFILSAEEILKIIQPEILSDALEVYIGNYYLINELGISHSRSEKWQEILKQILITGHEPGFQPCLEEFILHVINGPSPAWQEDYKEIWKQMCDREDLKAVLGEQLILETAKSNPSIPPCKALWKMLIAAHPGDQKSELAAKVALAIEAIQRHEPNDIFEFFDKEFLDMILLHCPLDLKILSTLHEYKDEPTFPAEIMEQLADEVAEMAKIKTIRLELTFDYLKKFNAPERDESRFNELELLPNKIEEMGKKWLAPRKQEPVILDWIL